MNAPIASSGSEPATRLRTLRTVGRYRAGVVATGIVLGLGLGMVHWLGLVLGGALVALPARTVRRGVAAGIAFGLLELALFGGLLAEQGTLGPALGTGAVGGISVAVGLAAPVLGSLVRGVI